jgi:hypothetical protein
MKPDEFSIIGRVEKRELGPDDVQHMQRLAELDARMGVEHDRAQSEYVAIFRDANQTYESKVRLKQYDPSWNEPVVAEFSAERDVWLFRDRVIKVPASTVPLNELRLRIMYFVAQYVQDLERMRRQLEALENLESAPDARRERIPESVRIFVWQRDQGRCVQCGAREELEFDHIIPVVEGGSNTERNIHLLCEPCNRKKGTSI